MKQPTSIRQRFEAKVSRQVHGCWLWTGAQFTATGYGMLNVRSDRDGKWRPTTAHRVAYELHVGKIPDGLVLDHLCRNRICVNPAHLEAVPQGVNFLRGVHPSAVGVRAHAELGGICTVSGCDEPIESKTWCSAHYQRNKRTGSPAGARRRTLRERLDAKAAKQPSPDGCWLWTGALKNGYGAIRVAGRTELAHRVSYEVHVGEISAGSIIGHGCRNRSCINPDHLRKID